MPTRSLRIRHLALIALGALGAAIGTTALAQTQTRQSAPVYRCGNQLSDRPCQADVPASSVRFDQPSPGDRAAARERSRQDAQQAQALQTQRERFEAQPSPPPQRLSAAAPPEVQASSAHPGTEKPRKVKPAKPAKPVKAPPTPKPAKAPEKRAEPKTPSPSHRPGA